MSADTPDPKFSIRRPEGDSRDRRVCEGCGWVDYENPKVVVGAVCTWQGKILLCKRAIEPRRGHWTIPAGYLELGETTAAGAAREVREEALAEIEIDTLIGVYSIARISQVLLIYRAEMISGQFGIGEETLDSALVDPDDIPWTDLAFPSVKWALEHYLESRDQSSFAPYSAPLQTGPLPDNGRPLES